MYVRLTKKLAEIVDGIDISHCSEGDVIDLPDREANVLFAEGWAEPVSPGELPTCAAVLENGRPAAAAAKPRKLPHDEDDDDPHVAA